MPTGKIVSSRWPLVAHQPDLLAGVLGVVAGIGLVGDEVGDRGGQHRQVEVDGHPAAQVAEVVVEPRPRLVGHQLPVDVLAVGQAERAGRCARGSRRPASRSPRGSLSGAMAWASRQATKRSPSGPEPGSTSSRRRWAASKLVLVATARAARRSRARPRRRRRSSSPASLRADVCRPTTWARNQRRRPAPSSGSPGAAVEIGDQPGRVGRQSGRRVRPARPPTRGDSSGGP